jgi:hypothetical protein
MSVHKIAQLNALLVLGIGAYGFLTDEPYWRSNGHGPWLYDYLFWCALALNGPSGFAADCASWLITYSSSNAEWRFVVQYGLWLLFLWPQWKGYDAVAAWCIGRSGLGRGGQGDAAMIMDARRPGGHLRPADVLRWRVGVWEGALPATGLRARVEAAGPC